MSVAVRAAAPRAPAAPPLLFGVDTVPVERVRLLVAAYDDMLARRIATAAEASWAGPSLERLALLFAVKEAGVKCLAGRPPRFRWQCVELDTAGVDAAGPSGPELPAAVAGTLAGLSAGVELTAVGDAACRVTGVGLERARRLLCAGGGATVRGAARYGTVDGHVLAVVSFWAEADDD